MIKKTLDERLIQSQETLLEGSMDCEFDITWRYLKGFFNKNTTCNQLAKRMRGTKWMRFSVLSSLRQSRHFNWLIHSWYCNPRKTAAGRRSRMWGDDCTRSAHLQKGHVDEISSDTFTQNASKHQVPLGVLNFVWWCHMITARGLEWLFCDSSTLPLAVTFWVVSALKAPTNTWDQLRQQAGNFWPPKAGVPPSILVGHLGLRILLKHILYS